MQRLTLEVPDAEYSFFTKLIDSLRFVRRIDEPKVKRASAKAQQDEDDEDRPQTKEEFLAEFREAFIEAREIASGKRGGKDALELLEELKREQQ